MMKCDKNATSPRAYQVRKGEEGEEKHPSSSPHPLKGVRGEEVDVFGM
jgi:hypothetical protein